MSNNFEVYKKQSIRALRELISLYEFVKENPTCCSLADDVHDDLYDAIFNIGCSLYPEACCVLDIIENVTQDVIKQGQEIRRKSVWLKYGNKRSRLTT